MSHINQINAANMYTMNTLCLKEALSITRISHFKKKLLWPELWQAIERYILCSTVTLFVLHKRPRLKNFYYPIYLLLSGHFLKVNWKWQKVKIQKRLCEFVFSSFHSLVGFYELLLHSFIFKLANFPNVQ